MTEGQNAYDDGTAAATTVDGTWEVKPPNVVVVVVVVVIIIIIIIIPVLKLLRVDSAISVYYAW